jgi:triosephosphate isomerase
MRKTIIAGNWKMYKTIKEAIELANGLKRGLFKLDFAKVDVVLCPAFTALSEVAEILNESEIGLGAQDIYWQEEGAFTGEVSPAMLKDAGCQYVIIGHSERRQFFGETNETVNKKIKAALKAGLTPIVCVGENLKERESNNTFKVIEDHVKNSLVDISNEDMLKIVVAYEPVWAIGTGKTATPEQAQEVHAYIRGLLKSIYGLEVSSSVRIQYGGSVKPENITELMNKPDVDGALVGGASLKVESFSAIVTIIHVVACLILIILVLIQRGRGAGLVESFAGVESMFGTKTNAFLTRTTTIMSIVFFFTCLSLALLSVRQGKSLMSNARTKAPVKQAAVLPKAAQETVKPVEAKVATTAIPVQEATVPAPATAPQTAAKPEAPKAAK